MAKNISTIHINATKSKVCDTLTKPELVKLWQYGSDLISNWELDNDIRFRTEWKGKIINQWGKVSELRPNELLKYSLFAPRPDDEDKPENYFIISYVLTTENDQTKLEIIREDNRLNAVQEDPQEDENPVLQSLKKVAESE